MGLGLGGGEAGGAVLCVFFGGGSLVVFRFLGRGGEDPDFAFLDIFSWGACLWGGSLDWTNGRTFGLPKFEPQARKSKTQEDSRSELLLLFNPKNGRKVIEFPTRRF